MRIARLFDTVDPVTGPGMDPAHPRLDPEEVQRVAAYLRKGALVLHTTARMADVLDPRLPDVVPLTFRTDGEWVWSDATTYYLERHGLAPDEHLLAAMRACHYAVPAVDDDALERAFLAVLQNPVTDDPAVWKAGQPH